MHDGQHARPEVLNLFTAQPQESGQEIFHSVLLLAETARDTGDWLWWDFIQERRALSKLSSQHENNTQCKQRRERIS